MIDHSTASWATILALTPESVPAATSLPVIQAFQSGVMDLPRNTICE